MGWISRDFRCDSCGKIMDVLLDREVDAITEQMRCDCGGVSQKILSAPRVMNHSHPDGTKRFGQVRETAKLRRARSDARAAGDTVSEKKLNSEIKKVNK